MLQFCRGEEGKPLYSRELVALGTSSQVPTRDRSHNAYMLRWDGVGILLDPGEGAQRQLTLANISASSIHHICITHFHGDHCLGLAGILQRLGLDRCSHPVHIYFPESGQIYFERLCGAAILKSEMELVPHPIQQMPDTLQSLYSTEEYALKSFPLEHSAPAVGYRLEERAKRRFLPEKLGAMGIHGPMVGELERNGMIRHQGKVVRLEEVTVSRQGSAFAFVMDTRPCQGALELAKNADLLVMEATFVSEHQDLAGLYFHSTAEDAARIALKAGAHKLALGHFSQRYGDTQQHLAEAGKIFPNVVVLNDLDCIDIPRRTQESA
jgi:ribonuclease Z